MSPPSGDHAGCSPGPMNRTLVPSERMVKMETIESFRAWNAIWLPDGEKLGYSVLRSGGPTRWRLEPSASITQMPSRLSSYVNTQNAIEEPSADHRGERAPAAAKW